jgi:hypothetical protein
MDEKTLKYTAAYDSDSRDSHTKKAMNKKNERISGAMT